MVQIIEIRIRGTFPRLIQSMYSHAKSCVTQHGKCSKFFKNSLGLMQGEMLSPLMFSILLNDFEISFISNGANRLFLLMYAVDLFLFSETVEGLQNLLDNLYLYSTKWKLIVNREKKTHSCFFRNGGKSRHLKLGSIIKVLLQLRISFVISELVYVIIISSVFFKNIWQTKAVNPYLLYMPSVNHCQ